MSGLVGIFGMFAGYYFASRKERRNEMHQMRLKSYADFISSVSRLVVHKRKKEEYDETGMLLALNDAKCRIIICADTEVVEALSDFWRKGCSLETESELLSFKKLCIQMRNSLKITGDKKNDINRPDVFLSDVLFQLAPSSSFCLIRNSKSTSCASPAERPEAAA